MADAHRTPDPDARLVSVPAWVLKVLADELAGRAGHDGPDAEPSCPICDAIRLAREAAHG